MLPITSAQWLIDQPDHVLSVLDVHKKLLATEYTFWNPEIVRNPTHEHIVRTDLTRQLGSLTTEIMAELEAGFDETWGFDTENWKRIGVFDNMMRIVARTSNRIFVGLPLCRNTTYLYYAICFAQAVPITAQIIRQIPSILQPLIGPILTLPNLFFVNKVRYYLEPEIKKRLADADRRERDPEKEQPREQNDFLQWQINYARNKLGPIENTPKTLVGRLLALNFAAIHTSTFGITNCIFDLLASDPANFVALRKEAEGILNEDGGVWTKKGLSRMHKIDSALRESLRYSSFLSAGLVRRVVVKEGLTTPDGVHLPYGIEVGVPAYGAHNDPNNYDAPDVYKPFRFDELRQGIEKTDTDGMIKKANYAMVSTSVEMQTFGHGRHACPGRFFAANELKLLLAYMVINYDVEPLAKRPESTWIGPTFLPPMKATISVRRRKGTEKRQKLES